MKKRIPRDNWITSKSEDVSSSVSQSTKRKRSPSSTSPPPGKKLKTGRADCDLSFTDDEKRSKHKKKVHNITSQTGDYLFQCQVTFIILIF